MKCSDAASGWAGWALAHPEFGSSVNPITTRGADYAHHITACIGALSHGLLNSKDCPWVGPALALAFKR